ncbi:MAG: AI-2E family transporter [Deinococcus sp.]|uniref:AI-2E family transporter n=1 Tax=Deinococcus sp. TaxID=47478 RepID=UPI0026DC17CE|nr:AI-2E family transporter [Deinococcus sp.]MDO4244734.1 AI-2E family transporter [Deinococcus sp.]
MATAPQTVPQLLSFLWSRSYVRLLVYTVAAVLLLMAARHIAGPLSLIAMAYALSYTVNPLLVKMEKHRITRPFGTILIMLALLGIMGLLFWTVASQVVSFLGNLPGLLQNLPGLLQNLLDRGQQPGDNPQISQTQAQLTQYVREQLDALSQNIGPLIGRVLGPDSMLYGQVSGVMNWLGQAGLVLTLAVFFMLDHGRFGRGILRLFPKTWQPRLLAVSEDISESFGNYIRGQLLLLLVISAIAGAGLLLLGVPNALALGLLTGLLNLVPLVGMVLSAIPALLQAIPQGNTTLLLVAALYFILNQLAWNVIAPMVMGRSVNMSAAGILIAIIIGGGLAGLPGALLAIPTASLVGRWLRRYWFPTPAYQGDGDWAVPLDPAVVDLEKADQVPPPAPNRKS